jgi:hypothetical protein
MVGVASTLDLSAAKQRLKVEIDRSGSTNDPVASALSLF